MEIYTQKKRWKYFLFFIAVLIGILSIWYTNSLMSSLSEEERERIKLWATATEELINSATSDNVNDLALNVAKNNKTIPIIMVDSFDNIIDYRNLDSVKMLNTKYREWILKTFKTNGNESYKIKMENETFVIYYADSSILDNVYLFPFFQLGIVFLFVLISYISFHIYKKAEQNHVWLGMSKETAHQLATPISSLMAWIEIMKTENYNEELTNEVEKDVKHLEKITARFSKIGSIPKLEMLNIVETANNSVEYLKTRIPKDISLQIIETQPVIITLINSDLLEWVFENICKNAADAIATNGKITIKINENNKNVYIDISDTGKGIPKSKFKTIFEPGYTTKKRGWGLGLSLVKRIIVQYHKGKVFVKSSKIAVGTTFRIVLKKKL